MRKHNYLILFPAFLQASYWGMMKLALPILPTLHSVFEVSKHSIHLMVSLSFVFAGLSHVAWGPLLDRLGFRSFITTTSCLAFCTLLLVLTAQYFLLFEIFYIASCVILTSYSIYSRTFPFIYFEDPGVIKKALSFRLMGGFSAAFLAPFIGGIMASLLGWRSMFTIIMAWLIFVLIISIAVKFKKNTNSTFNPFGTLSVLSIIKQHFKNKTYRKNLFILCSAYSVTQSYVISLPFWLEQSYNIPFYKVSFYLFPLLLPGMLSPFLQAYLNRYNPNKLILTCCIFFLISGSLAILLWFINFTSSWTWVVPGVIANVAVVAIAPIINYRAVETITEYKGTASSVLGGCSYILGGCAMYLTMFVTLENFYLEGFFILVIGGVIFGLDYGKYCKKRLRNK